MTVQTLQPVIQENVGGCLLRGSGVEFNRTLLPSCHWFGPSTQPSGTSYPSWKSLPETSNPVHPLFIKVCSILTSAVGSARHCLWSKSFSLLVFPGSFCPDFLSGQPEGHTACKAPRPWLEPQGTGLSVPVLPLHPRPAERRICLRRHRGGSVRAEGRPLPQYFTQTRPSNGFGL